MNQNQADRNPKLYSQTTQAPRTKPNHIVDWVLRIVPALIVGRAAMMKFSGGEHVSTTFNSLGMEPEGRILIGLIEALCVVLLLSPRLSAWGAILCLGVMTGAVIAHATVLGFGGSAGQLFVLALVAAGASVAIIYRLRDHVPFVRSMFEK